MDLDEEMLEIEVILIVFGMVWLKKLYIIYDTTRGVSLNYE